MDAKSYSLLHTQLCGVTSTGHIAPWLRAQPEHTQHGHAQQAGARARTRRRQTARAHRAHSTGTHACAAPSAPVRGRPSPAHACVHWLPWAAFTGGCGSPGRAAPPSCPRCPHTAATVPASVHEKRTCAKGARALKRSGRYAASFSGSSWSRTTTKGMARHGEVALARVYASLGRARAHHQRHGHGGPLGGRLARGRGGERQREREERPPTFLAGQRLICLAGTEALGPVGVPSRTHEARAAAPRHQLGCQHRGARAPETVHMRAV